MSSRSAYRSGIRGIVDVDRRPLAIDVEGQFHRCAPPLLRSRYSGRRPAACEGPCIWPPTPFSGMVDALLTRNGGPATMETVIPLAGLQSIYSVADVNRAAGDSTARTNEGLKGWYDRMRMLGGNRYIIKPSTHSARRRALRRVAQFRRRDRRLEEIARARHFRQRGGAVHADPAARRARPRQDAFRAQARARSRHRLRIRFAELADRGMGAVRRFRAVAQLAAGQDRADADRRRVRESGGRAGRSGQVGRRPSLRSDGSALHAARARYGAGLQGRVHRRRNGCVAHPVGGDRERRRRRFPSRS